jgi:hypothetical protein
MSFYYEANKVENKKDTFYLKTECVFSYTRVKSQNLFGSGTI